MPVTVTFNVGALPPGFCPSTWQLTFQGFVNALTGTVNGLSSTGITVSTTAPAAATAPNLWLQVSAGGVPIQLYSYNGTAGDWEPINGTFFFPGLTDTGIVNAYKVTVSPFPTAITPAGAPTSGLITGMTFVWKAGITNTGPSTFQVNAYAAAALQTGTTALTANSIVAGYWYMAQWDGTVFQLLNPSFVQLLTKQFQSGLFTVPTGGNSVATPHPLAAIPSFVQFYYVCQVANNNWVIGDIVSSDAFVRDDAGGASSVSGTPAFYWTPTTTNIILTQKNCAGTGFKVIDKTTHDYAAGATTEADWQFYFIAGIIPVTA